MARAGQGADHGRTPERRRGVQPMDVDALAQDDAGAQEADAGHDLGGDARRITLANKAGEHDEARRAQRHEGIGAQAGHLLVPLPLETDRGAQHQGE